MAQISNIRNTTPVSWPQSNKVHQADKQKDEQARSRKEENETYRNDSDDDNHIDEYA